MEEIIIVGAGFSGCILAREIAEKLNYNVRIIEKRNHIAGNAYDEYDDYGILVQRYGPHFLNTNNFKVIKYLQQFSELFPYDVKLFSYIDDEYVRLPFNFRTLQQLVGFENSQILLEKMRKNFSGRDRVPIFELLESNDIDIKNYGELLFEKAFRNYTAKQWGLKPEDIDRSVIERVPMAMNFDERYLNKDYQFLPKNGFTSLFKNMLNHPNISVELNCDALNDIEFLEDKRRITFRGNEIKLLIFTGEIDNLFSFKFGYLPYRSLKLTYEYFNKDKYLPSDCVSYPQAIGYTRKTEYKTFNYDCDSDYTVIATEYPVEYDRNSLDANIPYYPTLTKQSMEMYEKYKTESEKYGNIILCGRLAEFRYYNMDVCIEHALEKFEEVRKYLEEN